MCGIAGFTFASEELAKKMLDSISYRGPDDSGIYIDDHCTLAHNRLSILDLSSSGHQPMEFEGLVLVFNGEVYNFKEIRSDLEKRGYDFFSNSDSEVGLKALHCWGLEAIERFRGMFAFALYDKKAKKIHLVRDRVGVKPLYYTIDEGKLLFASELRAIALGVEKKIDKYALSHFFTFGYTPSENAIFEGVRKLLPAHILTFDLTSKDFTLRRYWEFEDFFHISKKSEKQLIDELEGRLIEGFRYRMVSDAPVGVFLSGGVDSSLVSAILQKHYGSIQTFTIGFKEQRYDESSYAKAIAKHIGSEHIQRTLKADEARELLGEFTSIYDEPFGDSSGIPTYLVSRVAKENGVKVVLSADGGDELFCGYERYWWSYNLASKIKRIPMRHLLVSMMELFTPLMHKVPIKNIERKLRFLKHLFKASSWQEIYETILQNYRDDLREFGLSYRYEPKEYFAFGETFHPMQGMMLWDFYNYLPNDILTKVDRATMANSIEGREPMLDHSIIEYSATIPFEYKYRDGQSKYILKKVLERYLPKELIYRKKMGFGIPMFEWFKNDLVDLFERYFQQEDDVIEMEYVRELFDRFKKDEYINVNKLWFVLVYLMWKERYY